VVRNRGARAESGNSPLAEELLPFAFNITTTFANLNKPHSGKNLQLTRVWKIPSDLLKNKNEHRSNAQRSTMRRAVVETTNGFFLLVA
jgi:hypothetical protein